MDLQSLALKALVSAMMVSVGLELRPRALLDAARPSLALGAALLANILLFPLLTGVAVAVMHPPEALATGMLLVAAAPGGPTSALFTRLAEGDLGFATATMVLLGLVGLVSAPLTVSLLMGVQGSADLIWPMSKLLAIYQIFPLVLAMAVRARAPDLASRAARPMGLVANLILLCILVALVAQRGRLLFDVSSGLHLVMVGLLIPLIAPTLWSRDPGGRLRAAGLVTAIRNISVALLLSRAFFADLGADLGVMIWGFWMMVLPAAAAGWRAWRRRPG